jgi:hypothetical protein
MRWPQFFDDSTYRNPSIWTWREWLTVIALDCSHIALADRGAVDWNVTGKKKSATRSIQVGLRPLPPST